MPQLVFDWRHHYPGDESSAYPAAEVELKGKDGHWRPFILFVDSGAHLTILSASDADRLGIDLNEGKSITLYGVSGSTKAFVHRLPMKLGARQLTVEVAFSISDDTPRLLGRAGIFDAFLVTFRQSRKKTIFTEEPATSITLE
jgi:hypothetical protein